MIELSEETHLTAFRFQIEGSWSVEEFQSFLLTLHDVYQRVAVVMKLGDLLRRSFNVSLFRELAQLARQLHSQHLTEDALPVLNRTRAKKILFEFSATVKNLC